MSRWRYSPGESTASEAVVRWLGGPELGAPHEGEPCLCWQCGGRIGKGSRSERFVRGPTYMDGPYLAERTGPAVVCGYCAALGAKSAMAALARCIVTPHGAFSIGRRDAQRWLWTRGPGDRRFSPPFVMVFTTAKLQHLVWRTPVSLSWDLVYLRFGHEIYPIRASALPGLAERAAAVLATGKARSVWRSCDPQMKDVHHGTLTAAFRNAAAIEDPALAACMDQLNTGEIWAMGPLVFPPKTTDAPSKIELDWRQT